jgi:membrane protease YdiL (CAAX protease family)
MKLVSDIKQHPVVSAVIGLLAAALLIYSYSEGKLVKMAAYLGAILLAALVTDFLSSRFAANNADFAVKSPAKELKFLLAVQIVIIILSIIRFQVFTDWQHTSFVFKLPLFILMLLFVFPIVLLIAFLRWKYSLKDLGFRLRGIWLGLPVILIIGVAAYFFAPQDMNFGKMYEEMGVIQMILVGFLVAAIPEELTRVLMQTRLGNFLENYAVGWLIAGVIWAFIHLPNFYSQNTKGLISAVWGVLGILPVGLLWGFMTHRTKSILPAVTVHGTNLWGLHDF